MARRIHRLSMMFATALVSLVVASSASAQSGERGASFELFGARVETIHVDYHTESYGVRGGFRFTPVWALEGSLSRLDEDVDVWFGDLSAKAYAIHSDRFGLYALAGPGLYRVSGGSNLTTVHLGIGSEISLGQ
jgi:hypothetical protein